MEDILSFTLCPVPEGRPFLAGRCAFVSVPLDFIAVRGTHWNISFACPRGNLSCCCLLVGLELFVIGILDLDVYL